MRAGKRVAVLVCVLLCTVVGSASASEAPSPQRSLAPLRAGLLGGRRIPEVRAGSRVAPAGQPYKGNFQCQKPSAEFTCYGPLQIRAAYDFAPLITKGKDGRGQTIVIIDAYQDPTLSNDLATFDSTFKLPAPPSYEVLAPGGITPFEPGNEEQEGWALEIALDVEWAHAVAPSAKIVLALSPSSSSEDVVATERYVVEHNVGDVVSMSYGETEECEAPAVVGEEHEAFKQGVEHGTTFLAGAGDYGAASSNCEFTGVIPHPALDVPASDPNVTAVGGTMLKANLNSGHYESESVWNEASAGWPTGTAGGGGFSALYAAPRYQKGVGPITTNRGVPDVAYSAAGHGGVIIALGNSSEDGKCACYIIRGTSVGAPQWAGLAAIANQVARRRLGNINPALYAIAEGKHYKSAFHDIAKGNNSYPPLTGYSAAPGWDPASGWGSPSAENLVMQLASSHPESSDQSSAAPILPSHASAPVPGAEQRVRPLAAP